MRINYFPSDQDFLKLSKEIDLSILSSSTSYSANQI